MRQFTSFQNSALKSIFLAALFFIFHYSNFGQQCPPGQYELIIGNDTTCTICPVGHYCPDGVNIYPCSANTFAGIEGLIICEDCPPGTQSPPGASFCTPVAECGDGFCDAFLGENCANCPEDCPCPPGQECIDSTCTYVVEGNVGVNNTDPKTALDIHGGLSHRSLNIVISSGDSIFIPANLSLAIISGYYFNFGDTIPVVLPNTLADGQRLIIQNKTIVKLGINLDFFNTLILGPNESIELIHTSSFGWNQLSSSPVLNENNWKLDGNDFVYPEVNFVGTKDQNDLAFRTNNIERMRVMMDGKIGIGTAIPEANLQINSRATISAPTLNLVDSTLNNFGGPYIQLTNLNNNNKLKIKGSIGTQSNGSDTYLDFFRNSNTLLSLRGDGNLGVNVLDPLHKLDVDGNTILRNNGYLEFGFGITKETNAGKIGYGLFGLPNVLSIVGGGTDISLRKIRFWSEGGAIFEGGAEVNGFLKANQTLGVGTSVVPSGYKVAVDGKIIAEELRIQNSLAWPDYVFEQEYSLLPLDKLEVHLKQYKHLPEVPSAKQVKEEGIQIGEMQNILLKKIEELTLYVIELNKEIDNLKKEANEK